MQTTKITDVKAGDKLIADGGFTCLKDGEVLTVAEAEGSGLYVPCTCGQHFLDGQESEDGTLVGLRKVQ